jgi:hypothetical protein
MKPVQFVISPVPNYLTFILCTVGINWNNEYTTQFSDFLLQSDQSYLLKYKTKLSFGDGDGDALTELFYFLPAHIGFDKDLRIIEYFQVLARSATLNNFSQLFVRFHTDLEQMRKFYPTFMKSFENDLGAELYSIIHGIAGIYLKYYDSFLSQVWYPIFSDMEDERSYIEILFRGKDIIGDWESTTGILFHSDSYKIGMIKYLRNGPQANSLSYDKNLFYTATDQDTLNYFRFFISHEVGTHLLKELTLDKFESEDINLLQIAYIACENIARYYNMKILPSSMKYSLNEEFYHDSVFESILPGIENLYPGDITKQYLASISQFHDLQK